MFCFLFFSKILAKKLIFAFMQHNESDNLFTPNTDYLNELNPVQRLAVETTEGPVMIIAGPGSGKTRVLTYRIAHLINKGTKPYNVLALTFTNKAAREMKARITEIVGERAAGQLWMGTFHSIFAKILRIEAKHLGYPSDFTIYDTDDSKSLIKTTTTSGSGYRNTTRFPICSSR